MGVTIKIQTEEQLEKVAKEAFYILSNLRRSTIAWNNDHGVATKNIRNSWEARADEFLKDPINGKNFHAESGLEIEKDLTFIT